MAKTPTFLAKTPVDVPNRSGFAMPFENLCTGRTGTLYPVLCKRVVPNETYSEEILFEAELPPMITNFFGRVDLCFESFFVPNHLLWGGWDNFFTHPTNNPIYPEGTPVASQPHNIPHILIASDDQRLKVFGRGTLGDFLGAKSDTGTGALTPTSTSVNSLPFLAYHRIYHDHYRNTVVQAPVFYQPGVGLANQAAGTAPYAATLPYVSGVFTSDATVKDNVQDIRMDSGSTYASHLLGDGVELTALRQANFDLDYFTAATPQPQAGGAATLTFDVAVDTSTGDGTGSFSIASLRMQNSIQQWMERNGLAGYDYQEQNFVQYGAYPKRNLTKALYLGNYRETVYNRSVFQTAQDPEGNSTSNPFGGVAAKFGASMANGRNVLFDNFKASDHGYLVVIMSLRPHAYYGTGVNRDLLAKYIGDIPFPLLSGVGDQPIYNYELLGLGRDSSQKAIAESVFGYIDQYANDKTCLDEVHGEFREGGQLEEFVLQRSFDISDGALQISSDFLEIPQDYLDQVKQVKSSVVPVDYWVSIFHNFSKVSPLPVYSVPTLGRLPNTHTETISRKKSTI